MKKQVSKKYFWLNSMLLNTIFWSISATWYFLITTYGLMLFYSTTGDDAPAKLLALYFLQCIFNGWLLSRINQLQERYKIIVAVLLYLISWAALFQTLAFWNGEIGSAFYLIFYIVLNLINFTFHGIYGLLLFVTNRFKPRQPLLVLLTVLIGTLFTLLKLYENFGLGSGLISTILFLLLIAGLVVIILGIPFSFCVWLTSRYAEIQTGSPHVND